jgi:hypothetical protein
MSEHTKPWDVCDDAELGIAAADVYLCDKDNDFPTLMRIIPPQGATMAATHEHIERMLDCINACESMADPAAEIARLRARIVELELEADGWFWAAREGRD